MHIYCINIHWALGKNTPSCKYGHHLHVLWGNRYKFTRIHLHSPGILSCIWGFNRCLSCIWGTRVPPSFVMYLRFPPSFVMDDSPSKNQCLNPYICHVFEGFPCRPSCVWGIPCHVFEGFHCHMSCIWGIPLYYSPEIGYVFQFSQRDSPEFLQSHVRYLITLMIQSHGSFINMNWINHGQLWLCKISGCK